MPKTDGARTRTLPAGWLGRAVIILSVLTCLLFSAGLRDVSGRAFGRRAPRPPTERSTVHEGAGALRITLLDPARQPVPGGRVEVFAMVDGQAISVGAATSDERGVVRVHDLPLAEIWLRAEAPEHARVTSRLVLDAAERDIELTLGPAHLFEVVTVDSLQRPIRGVTVRIYGTDPLPAAALTDAQGLATLERLGPPPYAVEIEAKGFDTKLLPRVGLEESPLFVKLEPLGTLEIVVLEPGEVEGQGPKRAARAKVTVAGSSLWPARAAETDDNGQVTIAGLPRGFYDLRAERDELVSGPELGVLLDRGETKEVQIELVPGGYVVVKVTDGEGTQAPPIPNADVAVVEGGISSFPLYGRTNAAGLVTLGPLAGLDANVSARADGFVPRSAVPIPEESSSVQVGLSRGGSIVGRVVDEQDYPVEGASIEVMGVDIEGMPIAESSTVTGFREDHFAFALPGAVPFVPVGELGVMPLVPDIPGEHDALVVSRSSPTADPWVSRSDGGFELRPVSPGRVHLVVNHPDYVEAVTETVRLEVGKEIELKVVLRRGALLEGRVVEEDGSPVSGARVELAALEGSLERVTFAADDGVFAFAAVPPQVLVSVARPDAMDTIATQLSLHIGAGERAEVQIVLPQRRDAVTIAVSDDRGYPLDRVEVRALSLEPGEPLRITQFTDDAGEAVIPGAAGLPLRIVLSRSAQAPLVAQLESVPERVALLMAQALSARGEVRDQAGPIEGASVTIYTPTGPRHAQTDPNGEFVLQNLAATPVRLLVHKSGYAPREVRADITGDPDTPVDLGLIELEEGGTVEGEVLDENADPVAGAWVSPGRVPTYLPLGPLPLGMSATDRSGRFVLHDLEPGTVPIEAYAPGIGRNAADDIVVRAGETTSDVRIVLTRDEAQNKRPEGAGSLAVTLGERVVRGKPGIYVEHVPAGGEAERSGIEPGDQILAVNGAKLSSMEQARLKLTGPLSEDMVLLLSREPDWRWLLRVSRERLRR